MQFPFGSALLNTIFITLFFISFSVYAKSDLDGQCQSISVENGLRLVTEACPVGEGLWGRKPAKNGGHFWVQCGIYPEGSLGEKRRAIEQALDNAAPLVFRQEPSQLRCLVGPFEHHHMAFQTRNLLRQLPLTADAFIRQVDYPKARKTKPKAAPSSARQSQSARTLTQVAGLWTLQPKGDDARYTRGRQDWWRATFDDAQQACRDAGKQLVSEKEIRRAVEQSGKQGALPNTIPYWLNSGKVYDIKLDMAFVAITDTLTLNVLCE